jgi:hypothetical protein
VAAAKAASTTTKATVATISTAVTAKAILIGIRAGLATQGILLQAFPIDIGVGFILRRIGPC